MANVQANRTLSGSFAEVWVDGAKIAELSELNLTVKLQKALICGGAFLFLVAVKQGRIKRVALFLFGRDKLQKFVFHFLKPP